MSKMRRNRDVPHIGRVLADKAAELGSALYCDPVQRLVQMSYSDNVLVPNARTASAKKKLGMKESDMNPGNTSKNKLGGTPVREIEPRTNSYNE